MIGPVGQRLVALRHMPQIRPPSRWGESRWSSVPGRHRTMIPGSPALGVALQSDVDSTVWTTPQPPCVCNPRGQDTLCGLPPVTPLWAPLEGIGRPMPGRDASHEKG